MAQNEVRVVITGDSSALGTALTTAAGGLEGFRTKAAAIGASMRSVGQMMTLGLTLPIVGLGVLFGKELGEAQKVSAQTEAVLKSTGGVAGTTAGEVSKLAEELMKLSGVDDEVIASGENLLLTFTNIRNGVGEGNDIFNQATRAALDMSVAMGTDMSTAAMQVGKALNDPIAGVGALRRVGVQLSEQQQQQIKDFMAVSDVASAQKVILGELATQFEGSAEAAGGTAAGKYARLRESLMNVGAQIMETLLPAFEKMADWLQKAADWIGQLSPGWQQFIAIAAVVVAAIGPLLMGLGGIVTAIGLIATPVGLVVLAIAALAAAFIYFYTTNEGFREWVNSVASAIWGALKAAFDWVKDVGIPALITAFSWLHETLLSITDKLASLWEDHRVKVMHVWNTIVDLLRNAWNTIRGVVEGAIQAVRGVIQIVTGLISGDWSRVWEGVKNVFGGIWSAIYSLVSGFIGQIWAVISNGAAAARDALGGRFMEMVSAVGNAVTGIMSWVTGLPGRIIGAFAGAGRWLYGIGRDILDGLLDGLKSIWAGISRWISDKVASIPKMFKGMLGISSPSKVMAGIGENIMAGLEVGLGSGSVSVDHQIASVASAVAAPSQWQPSGTAAAGGGTRGGATHLHFHGPVARDSESWILDLLARTNRNGSSAIPGVA